MLSFIRKSTSTPLARYSDQHSAPRHGLGYAFYIDHPDRDTNGILLSPGSQIAFDIFIGDFRINFHDRFSLQQDPIDELQLSNVVDYGRFENTAGVSVMWDLNKAVLTLGYDHYTYISTNSDFDISTATPRSLSARLPSP